MVPLAVPPLVPPAVTRAAPRVAPPLPVLRHPQPRPSSSQVCSSDSACAWRRLCASHHRTVAATCPFAGKPFKRPLADGRCCRQR
eukprot:2605045-Prymnesium_polylepis.1